jgi:hypothetical protein
LHNVDDGLGKGLQGLLRKIVSDAAFGRPMLVFSPCGPRRVHPSSPAATTTCWPAARTRADFCDQQKKRQPDTLELRLRPSLRDPSAFAVMSLQVNL